MSNVESSTWLDLFPTEIIHLIFEYLSNDEIISTFYSFNRRFQNIILENRSYFKYVQMSTNNLRLWNEIPLIMQSRIECLNLNTIYFPYPLKNFANMKSLILSSRYGFADEELKSIIESDQFNRLESFRLKENHRSSSSYSARYENYFNNHEPILTKVFNNANRLKIFQYSLIIPSVINQLQINRNLHSLTIILINYEDIFSLLQYAPNLMYLNAQSEPPSPNRRAVHQVSTKLKQLNIKFCQIRREGSSWIDAPDWNQFTTSIQQFSYSLTCLSLNLATLNLHYRDNLLMNSIELQRFLQSMVELKEFHSYAKVVQCFDYDRLLSSRFRDQFWLDHHWSFGMHGDYIYTLPFHYDYLHEFPSRFLEIRSNNPEILTNNPRLWYKVKTIELPMSCQYDRNFLEELQMKMPNLNSIKLINPPEIPVCRTAIVPSSAEERNEIDGRLHHLTTMHFIGPHSLENQWLMRSVVNLRHLILSARELSSIKISFKQIFGRMSHTSITSADFTLKQLVQINEIYFPNLQHLVLCLIDDWVRPSCHADTLVHILKRFSNLKSFLLYIDEDIPKTNLQILKTEINEHVKRILSDEALNNYEVKCFHRYCLFSKRLSNNNDKVEEKTKLSSH